MGLGLLGMLGQQRPFMPTKAFNVDPLQMNGPPATMMPRAPQSMQAPQQMQVPQVGQLANFTPAPGVDINQPWLRQMLENAMDNLRGRSKPGAGMFGQSTPQLTPEMLQRLQAIQYFTHRGSF